jgi:chromosome segregation ATPase
MDLAVGVALLALIVSAIALGVAGRLRSQLRALNAAQAELQQAHDRAQQQREQQQREVEQVRRELVELTAAAEIVPVPPLPKGRSGRLDDLREQLRAAHREPASDEET